MSKSFEEEMAEAHGMTVAELYFHVTMGPAVADDFDPAHVRAQHRWNRFLARSRRALSTVALTSSDDEEKAD